MEGVEIIPKSYPTNLLQKDWSKRKCYLNIPAVDFMAKVHDMEVRDDDVWLVTLPKCGTTWMQELLWLVINDFDFEGAKSEHLEVRSPYLEFDFFLNKDLQQALKPVEELKSPRLIKSHLPLPLLPAQLWQKRAKVIYVYRNPMDALISLHYHGRSLGRELNMSVEDSLREYVEKGALTRLPFEHVAEFHALREEPWLYYTSYERMKSDLASVIRDICQFLNKSITAEQMQQMLKHLSFEEMKQNPKTNHHWEFDQVRRRDNVPCEPHDFIRKGKVNGYKEELSADFINFMNDWITSNLALHNLTLKKLLLLEEK